MFACWIQHHGPIFWNPERWVQKGGGGNGYKLISMQRATLSLPLAVKMTFFAPQSFRRNDFRDRLGGQALLVSGWFLPWVPKRFDKWLRGKLVSFSLLVSGVGNCVPAQPPGCRFRLFRPDWPPFGLQCTIEPFHSRGQYICKFIGTKESVCIRKEFNSQRTGLGHQYGRRDVMWKHSIPGGFSICYSPP